MKEFVIMVQIVICTHERIDVGLPAEGEGRAGEVEEQGQDLQQLRRRHCSAP